MSSAIASDTPLEPGSPPFPIHRFTVAEYEELTRLGVLTEDSNVELLEGWIAPKMTKHPPHDNRIDLLNHLLTRLLPAGWFVRVQNCIVTADSVPEPDLAVVKGRPGDYEEQHPTGTCVGLVVEVADATIRRDRAKAAIYARAGIPHYWIVNLDDGQIETYSQPKGKGLRRAYQATKVLKSEGTLKIVLDTSIVGSLSAKEILNR
jgi:Uma2 family endonuclease